MRPTLLPYTDVDYLVFSDAAKLLVDACPLSTHVEQQDYEVDEDLLKRNDLHCAQGIHTSCSPLPPRERSEQSHSYR